MEKAFARPPDLILIDLAMPVLDGRAAIQMLASDPVTARVPVLAMSAQTFPSDASDTADTFLPKPCEPDQLLAQIRATLRRGPTAANRGS